MLDSLNVPAPTNSINPVHGTKKAVQHVPTAFLAKKNRGQRDAARGMDFQ